jgi:uncharacterized protein DUF4157
MKRRELEESTSARSATPAAEIRDRQSPGKRTLTQRLGQAPLQRRSTPAAPGAVARISPEEADAAPALYAELVPGLPANGGGSMPAELLRPGPSGVPVASSVQLRGSDPQRAGSDPAAVPNIAAVGVSGPGTGLPHLEQIQLAFGDHDVSGVVAHTGGQAASAATAIGAEAYATGDHVAFAGTPSLHTAAHEAAHVVQQRGGVSLAGGVGRTGDIHELHADQVADAVVAGRSAEALLDTYAGGGAGSATPGVQRTNINATSGSEHDLAPTPTLEPEAVEAPTELAPNLFEALQALGHSAISLGADESDEKSGGTTASTAEAEEKPLFPDLETAYAYLAKKFSYEVEELEVLALIGGDLFSALLYLGPSDIDDDLARWRKELEGLELLYKHQPDPGTGKSSRGDWATKKVRKSAADLKDAEKNDPLFPGGEYTVHHKIPRTRLRRLHTNMDEAGAAATPLHDALREIGAITGTESPLKILLNIPANLEVGPPTQRRVDDPGPGFDGNHEHGAMTPRSTILEVVDGLLQKAPVDFAAVAAKLLAAHQLHLAALEREGGTVLTPPKTGQWTKKGNKFKRG